MAKRPKQLQHVRDAAQTRTRTGESTSTAAILSACRVHSHFHSGRHYCLSIVVLRCFCQEREEGGDLASLTARDGVLLRYGGWYS